MFTFNTELSIGDLLTFCVLLIASIGLFLNFFEMRRGYKQKRAEYIISLYNAFISDKEIMDVYYEIEDDDFRYSDEETLSKEKRREKEQVLDKLLGYFENIAKLYELRCIPSKDLRVVAYEFMLVNKNESVQNYLNVVDEECLKNRTKEKARPYEGFKRVGGILEKKFKDKPRKKS